MASRRSTGRSRSGGSSRSRRKSAPARGARRKAARSRSTPRSTTSRTRTRRASSRGRSSSGARKYGPRAQQKVEKVMRERKRGTLRSGGSGKKVTSRKQAIAIGLSEARRAGAKVPARRGAARKK